MTATRRPPGLPAGRWLAAGLGLAATGYAASVLAASWRYGRGGQRTSPDEADPLLDRFMPVFEVVERHRTRVAAPADVTLAAACSVDLEQSAIVRSLFRVRALVLGGAPTEQPRPRGLLAQVRSLGWGVLAEVPGREIVLGAVTRPWMADVTFRAVPPDEFAAFSEPGYVKIAWMLRADPLGPALSVARTETRVATTDATARARFRWYWSFASPGIAWIRRIALRLAKREAERIAREGRPAVGVSAARDRG